MEDVSVPGGWKIWNYADEGQDRSNALRFSFFSAVSTAAVTALTIHVLENMQVLWVSALLRLYLASY